MSRAVVSTPTTRSGGPGVAHSTIISDPRVIDQHEAGVTIAGTLARTYRDDCRRQAAIEKAVGRLVDGAD